jgi:hypothetical protein
MAHIRGLIGRIALQALLVVLSGRTWIDLGLQKPR